MEGLTAAWTMVVLASWTWSTMAARMGNDLGMRSAWDKTASQAQDQLRVKRNNVPLTESMSCPGTAGDIPGQNIPVIEVPWTAYVEDEASNVELFR
ncbi:hypothetical protein An07g04720 [Aspergillus niger]|uniref:Uncharacterized protein n=2 Tax=Aspergillus niger TaxID=5061 RepID=A2QN82_ASPNC|nr:hypothetical protein An07g04720 [Aspergillus niger]CAK39391.1 hypothetical protein An07g04720 [Aspergillus niger]